MADIEKEVILKVGTADGIKNVAELQQYIKALKEALKDNTKSYEENKAAAEQLRAAQAALRIANKETTLSVEEQIKRSREILTVDGQLVGSYNQLSRAVTEMKNAYHATTNEVERSKLAAEIARGDKALKEMDENVGKYGRNVGNYKSALAGLSTAISSVGASSSAASGALRVFISLLKALAVDPLVLGLTAIATAFTAIAKGIKSSEENTYSWSRAIAAFKPIGDAFLRDLQDVGEEVAKLANRFVDLLYKWGLLDQQAGKDRQALSDFELSVTRRRRILTKANAQLEAEIAEAREKAADKEKYSAAERLKALQEAQDAEKKLAKNRLQLAQDQVDLLTKQASYTKNNTAVLDSLAEAEANIERVRAQNAQNARSLLREINRIQKEVAGGSKAAAVEVIGDVDGIVDAILKGAKETEDALQNWLDDENKKALAHEDIRLQNLENGTARRLEVLDRETLNAREKEDRVFEIELDGMNRRLGLLDEFRQAALDRGDLEAYLKYDEEYQNEQFRIEQAGYNRRKTLRDRETTDRKAALQAMVSFTSTILNSVADVYESAGDMSEAEAQRMKGLRIAAAIIETIAGAVSAYMGTIKAMSGSPFAIPVAAANAAGVLAAGYAQVARIQNTDATGKGSASTGGAGFQSVAVSAPAPVQMVPVTRSLTGAQEEARLNEQRNIRVNLVYSDVQAAGERVNVVDSETEL